jgi:Amt family ammonium transporter
MAGAYFLGPRIGKFVKDEETGKIVAMDIPGHNAVLAALGTLILWFGFLPFNAGAGYAIAGEAAAINTGRAVVVTVLAGASGACTLLLFAIWKLKHWNMAFAMNGLLGGMVATCSGVNVYDTWIAVVIGILGAAGFYVQDWLFENVLHIDDPLGASALHMGSGMVGLISVGFFANSVYVDDDPNRAGVFYGGNGKQLGYQLYGLVVYFAWAFGVSSIMFWGLNRLGWLRISEEMELMGIDVPEHGRVAYPRSSIKVVDETERDEETGGKKGEADDAVSVEMALKDHVSDVGESEEFHHDIEDIPATKQAREATLRQRRKSWADLEPGQV